MKLCSVSVDLDEIPNYFHIHGLDVPATGVASLVYDTAIDRLCDFAKVGDFPLTLFAIGADLERRESAARLRLAGDSGHELANHSLNHRYDLTRLGKDEIRREIEGGREAIRRATGKTPTGFRAPGYTINQDVFDVLGDLDVAWDSSVFPCPAYWAAKTAAIGLIGLRGRTSRSVVDTPRVLTAPTRPYRIGTPYWNRGRGLLELPIQVTRVTRLPLIGTSITLWGPTVARSLAKGCVGEPFVNIELHGIDVLDASDGLEALRPHQPDVRVTTAQKLEALAATFEVFKAAGYDFVTMSEAAHAFS